MEAGDLLRANRKIETATSASAAIALSELNGDAEAASAQAAPERCNFIYAVWAEPWSGAVGVVCGVMSTGTGGGACGMTSHAMK